VLVLTVQLHSVPCLLAIRAHDCSVVLCVPLLPALGQASKVRVCYVLWDEKDGLCVVVGLAPPLMPSRQCHALEAGAVDVSLESSHPPAQTKLWGVVVRQDKSNFDLRSFLPALVLVLVLVHVTIPVGAFLTACAPGANGSAIDGDASAEVHRTASEDVAADGAADISDAAPFVHHGLSKHITARTLLTRSLTPPSEMIPIQGGKTLLCHNSERVFALECASGRLQWAWSYPHNGQDKSAADAFTALFACDAPGAEVRPKLLKMVSSLGALHAYLHFANESDHEDTRSTGRRPGGLLIALRLADRKFTEAYNLPLEHMQLEVPRNGACVFVAPGKSMLLLHPATLQQHCTARARLPAAQQSKPLVSSGRKQQS